LKIEINLKKKGKIIQNGEVELKELALALFQVYLVQIGVL
jgi:hypothetical protein